MKIQDIKEKLPKDLKTLFRNSSFYIKQTSNGDVISVMCPPYIADMLNNNVLGVKDKLSQIIKEHFGYEYPIEPAISKETIEAFREGNTDKKKGGILIPNTAQLNPNRTFETFEVSSCNESAFKTAFAYSVGGADYSLLFIHGGYGLGKSHLLNAVANQMLKRGKTVAFFTSNSFNEYVLIYTHTKDYNLKLQRIEHVKYADIFILDDVHLLKGRTIAQEELKMFIDYFFAAHKPMVFSSLFNVNKLLKLSNMYMEEVISRFEEGMPIHLLPPDFQLKFALLTKFFTELNVRLPEDTIREFATIDVKNIRDLKNFANSVHSIIDSYGYIPKEEIVNRLFVEYKIRVPAVEEQKINAYIEQCGYPGITLGDLKDKSIRYKKDLRKLRDDVITHFALHEHYSNADLGRIFNLTRSAVSFIVKNNRSEASKK